MMEFSELKETIKVYEKLKQQAIAEFVMSHCTVKIGDVINSNQDRSIVVDKITVSVNFGGKACAVCHGLVLKKDGTPRKDKERASVYLASPCKVDEYL